MILNIAQVRESRVVPKHRGTNMGIARVVKGTESPLYEFVVGSLLISHTGNTCLNYGLCTWMTLRQGHQNISLRLSRIVVAPTVRVGVPSVPARRRGTFCLGVKALNTVIETSIKRLRVRAFCILSRKSTRWMKSTMFRSV